MKGQMEISKKLFLPRLPAWHTFWVDQNKKIIKTCALVVVPMLTLTIAMICIVFTTKIDPNGCPDPALCTRVSKSIQSTQGMIFMTIPVGRLTFVSSISATLAGLLVAAQMTLFSHVMAGRMLRAPASSGLEDTPMDAHSTSLLIRFLNAEIPLLWDLYTRKVACLVKNRDPQRYPRPVRMSFYMLLVGLLCSILIQGANTYFHATIEATSIVRRFASLQQEHKYSNALAPWCYDDNDTVGTTANRNYWSCALDVSTVALNDNETYVVAPARFGAQEEINRGYQQYLNNFTDVEGVSYALIAASGANASVDWTGKSYAASTTCRAIPSKSCAQDHEGLWLGTGSQVWPFDCSSVHEGFSGNITSYGHVVRLADFHNLLQETPPFMNRDYRPKLRVSLIKNLTKPAFKNPFTFVSQLDITNTDDGKTSEALTGSDLAWKMLYTGPQSELLPIKFIFSCSTSVWDVVYTMSDGRVQTLVANTSNSTVTGAVSMMASSYSNPFRLKMNEVYQEVNSNTTTITPEEVTKRYELEMSKALISGLIVNTVALPVDAAQLRRNEVVTRLPAVALWFLVSTNFLFMLLAISLAIWATRSSSTEVHQAQLRLSSAGLAAQLFSHQTSTLAVKDDFELFHDKENIIEGEEEKLPLVTICSSALGGAEFVVQSTSKASDDSEQERYSFIGRPAPRLANRVTL